MQQAYNTTQVSAVDVPPPQLPHHRYVMLEPLQIHYTNGRSHYTNHLRMYRYVMILESFTFLLNDNIDGNLSHGIGRESNPN